MAHVEYFGVAATEEGDEERGWEKCGDVSRETFGMASREE